MSSNDAKIDRSDPVVAYYRALRDALMLTRLVPELQDRRFCHGIEEVLNILAMFIIERSSPSDLNDVRDLDPELRDGGALFALDKLRKGNSGDLGWLADRLCEFGGVDKALSDPDIRSIGDLDERL